MIDLEAIQGIWQANSDDGRIVIPISETMFGSKLLYNLNQDKQPKEIDLEHRRPRARPKSAAQGIYSLHGDTLTICWGYGGDRPTEFVADRQKEHQLLVLRREESV